MSHLYLRFAKHGQVFFEGVVPLGNDVQISESALSDLRSDLSRMVGYARGYNRDLTLEVRDGAAPPPSPDYTAALYGTEAAIRQIDSEIPKQPAKKSAEKTMAKKAAAKKPAKKAAAKKAVKKPAKNSDKKQQDLL